MTAAFALVLAASASASEQVYFAATDNIKDVLVQKINAETVRIDMSIWYLTEHEISIALANRFHAGVPVRLIGDRASMFEIDLQTKLQFYWLASQGVPIRLRYNPTWYPEIDHWKTTIFAGQNIVEFGSSNYTPFELAPISATNYKDEVVLFTDDPALVGAFRTKFDKFWNDTTPEPESLISNPPFFKNWDDACALESACSDYRTMYPSPAPMNINTARLEPDYPLPPEMNWGQGSVFNNRLTAAINGETSAVDFIIYRMTVDNITNALLARHAAGVPVRLIIEPQEYLNRKWPEMWLTHAQLDRLWAAGVPMKKRIHDGITHMKTLITSQIATIASSNFTAFWQRDQNYFLPAAQKPALYQAVKDRFNAMWNDPAGFAPFVPQPPDAPVQTGPVSGATGVSTSPTLTWHPAPFATNFDVYFGPSPSSMTAVANVAAVLSNSPPDPYGWTPPSPLQSGTTYYWKIVSRTNATSVNATLIAPSAIWSFTTAGTVGPPAAPSNPSPSNGATGVGLNPTLGWSAGAVGTTFNVAFGSANPPPTVATGLSGASYAPGVLAASTTYFWSVTAVSNGGSTAGPVWSFTTSAGGGGTPTDIVIYASDVTATGGTWTTASDPSAAGGVKMRNPDANAAIVDAPLANPPNYFDATFQALAGTRYRVWLRIHASGDSKWNDSIYVQFSDSVTNSGNPVYRIGTPGGYIVNLWTCATCQSIGWGWQRNAYWLSDTGDVWFQNSGQHTIRVQTREDGAEIDQIVISPTTFATNAPGPVSNDSTIVPKPSGPTPPPGVPGLPNPADGASGVSAAATLTWSASNATSYNVFFGTTNPPPHVLTTNSTSYSPSNLASDTTYFWKIAAANDGGTTTGPVWSFRTAVTPPAMPNSPNPANGATGVSMSTILGWSAAGATSFDVFLDTSDPPSQVASALTTASYSPSGLAASTTYYWQIVAHNTSGDVQGPTWSFTTAAAPPPPIDEIVIYASDVPAAARHGNWTTASDVTSPSLIKLITPDNGESNTNAPLAGPVQYFDVAFDADASKTYTVWLRVKALNNNKYNDSLWVQFANARVNGSQMYAIGSTSALMVNLATDVSASSLNGWGWTNSAYWLSQPTTITFPSAGTQTMRVQIREDGVQIDQIVLSHANYLTVAPGPPTNDATIVQKP